MMRSRLLILGLAAALIVAPVEHARAQATASVVVDTPAGRRSRLESRLDPRTRVAVEHVIDSAAAAGIPTEPLVDKALEGASKRAPAEAIVRAIRGLAVDLSTARQWLGPQSLSAELTAGASAIRAGVDTDALRRLRHDRPGQPLVIALSVLTDLIASGVPADNATRSVLALTNKGAVDEQLVAFRRDVERDIGIGAPPGIAASVRLGDFRASLNVNDPGRAVSPPRKPRP